MARDALELTKAFAELIQVFPKALDLLREQWVRDLGGNRDAGPLRVIDALPECIHVVTK